MHKTKSDIKWLAELTHIKYNTKYLVCFLEKDFSQKKKKKTANKT